VFVDGRSLIRFLRWLSVVLYIRDAMSRPLLIKACIARRPDSGMPIVRRSVHGALVTGISQTLEREQGVETLRRR
jgi:hypothetical protein